MSQNTPTPDRFRWVPLSVLGMLLVALVLIPTSQFSVLAGGSPPPPVLLSPLDFASVTPDNYPPVAVPEVEWAPVEGATMYRVQFSNDIAFTTTPVNITTPLTKYTPTVLSPFADGDWYWRVRVDSSPNGFSEYSNPRTFNKQWATDTNKPVLVTPPDFSTLTFYDFPIFSWDPVIGAAQYRLEIDNNPDFSSLTYSVLTVTTTHQPLNKLANGTYYWRVVPVDAANRSGTPSDSRQFNLSYNEVPILLEPANNSNPTFTPTFRWEAVRGAQYYRLQYSTDPTFNTAVTQADTRNTTYTPITTLPNDVNYFWRVRAISGSSESDWSTVYTFIKRWYIQPIPLAPTNVYQNARMGPIFYWTPVPAASKYRIEIDTNPDFINLFTSGEVPNTFFTPSVWGLSNPTYYWRVIPIDGSGRFGQPSEVFSLQTNSLGTAPELVYPLFYYNPLVVDPNAGGNVPFHPAEDRTIPYPIFVWHRAIDPISGGTYANAYRLQVDDNPNFTSVDWQYDTETLNAVPTNTSPFTPVDGVIYYWRVASITGIGGSVNGHWSQTWQTRFDSSLGLTPTIAGVPQLIRPANEEEHIEYTPRLDWWPYVNSSGQPASSYEVQISWDTAFTNLVTSSSVPYPSYAPHLSIAERHLNKNEYGTFYWRVRAIVNGSPTGWSETRRFQVAAQSQWLRMRAIGDALAFKIGSDPVDQVDNNYELTNLYATQSLNAWLFAFDATKTATNMTYAIYLDKDAQENSGATTDACGYNVTTINAHRPEYILYIFQISNNFTAANTALYTWNSSTNSWNVLVQSLADIGGSITYVNNTTVEVWIPNTPIGFGPEQGSYNVSVLSFQGADTDCSPAPGTQPVDMTPGKAGATGNVVQYFSGVSDRPQLVSPFNSISGDPTAYSSVIPFAFEFPTGFNTSALVNPNMVLFSGETEADITENIAATEGGERVNAPDALVAPWAGGRLQVYYDPLFTSPVPGGEIIEVCSNCTYLGWQTLTFGHDLQGDNSYYWRFRTRYLDATGEVLSPWSEGFRFEREGFVPQNLQYSVDFATPTFSWDIVEGARTYSLQVDNDPTFATPEVNIETTQSSYTPQNTLDNGTYYWRVRVRRENNVTNDWTSSQSFTLSMPVPQNLLHYPITSNQVVGRAPTFCWDPLVVNDGNNIPVLPGSLEIPLAVQSGLLFFDRSHIGRNGAKLSYTL